MDFNLMAIDPIAFELGPISVAWYGLIIVTGMILAIYLISREAEKRGISEDSIVDIAFWTIPIGIIGARIYYVLFELEHYLNDPIRMLFIWEGGLAIYGGVIAGFLTIYYLAKKKDIPLLLLTDIIAPNLMLAQAIGRWGNFINQEAHGAEVSRQFLENLLLPEFIIEGMYINEAYYHPTFLYESVWNIIGLVLLLVLRNREHLLLRGESTTGYLIWYGIGRFLIEGMRTDSLYMGPFRVSQIVSIVIILLGIGLVIYQRRFAYPKPQYYTDGMQYEVTYAKKKEKYENEKQH